MPVLQISLQRQEASLLQRSFRNLARYVPAPGREEIQAFCKLLETPRVKKFLEYDQCCIFADRYLIAMVFAYFARARFTAKEYTRENFFTALTLAIEMEEDFDELKGQIFAWNIGKSWPFKFQYMLQQRFELFRSIGYRALVSYKCCHQVMDLIPGHWVWTRERPQHHAGALKYLARMKMKYLWMPQEVWAKPNFCLECLKAKRDKENKEKRETTCFKVMARKLTKWVFPDSDEELCVPPRALKKQKNK